jgi:hypothetical protein
MDECAGIDDRAIHMALRREVDHSSRTMLLENGGYGLGIADIRTHQLIARIAFQ